MTTPKYLKKGDKIGIVSVARKISEAELQPALNKLKEWGLNVILGAHVYQAFNQFAGNDEQRASDFQRMLDDKSIKAIFCTRGGYGTVKIIEKLNFDNFLKKHRPAQFSANKEND